MNNFYAVLLLLSTVSVLFSYCVILLLRPVMQSQIPFYKFCIGCLARNTLIRLYMSDSTDQHTIITNPPVSDNGSRLTLMWRFGLAISAAVHRRYLSTICLLQFWAMLAASLMQHDFADLNWELYHTHDNDACGQFCSQSNQIIITI